LKTPTPTTLIVEGFGPSVSESELRRLFEQVGAVASVVPIKDADGNTAAMLTMAAANDAEDAILKFDGTHFRGIVLRVRKA
jgi:hypothetical protein